MQCTRGTGLALLIAETTDSEVLGASSAVACDCNTSSERLETYNRSKTAVLVVGRSTILPTMDCPKSYRLYAESRQWAQKTEGELFTLGPIVY